MKEEVTKWWKVTLDDLETSKYNLRGNKLAAAAFYAQQAVEKGLKTLLLHRNKSFEKTHDITRLSILVSAPNKIKKLCSALHPIYFESRYPDRIDFEEFTNKEYNNSTIRQCQRSDKMDRKRIREEIMKIVKKLKEKNKLDKVILFGSFARGDFGKYSDVDIIAISKKFKGIEKLKRSPQLYYDIHNNLKLDFDVDIACYTPDEFKNLRNKSILIKEASEQGIEI